MCVVVGGGGGGERRGARVNYFVFLLSFLIC